jgi:hypothetical protein
MPSGKSKSFRVGNTVFLNCDSPAAKGGARIKSGKHLAPRVGLWHSDCRNQPQFFKRGNGLRTSRDEPSFPERRYDSFLGILGEERLIERPRADAGHENQQVERAGFELRQKLERRAVFAKWNFAH